MPSQGAVLALDLPRLRILDLSMREGSEPLCSALASGAFARLEVLRLQILGNHNYEEVPSQMMVHLLQGLVDRPLPALRVVELRVVYWRTRGEAEVLARAPWLSQLERLVVRGWQFEPEAEEALRALGSCVELETVGPHVHELV